MTQTNEPTKLNIDMSVIMLLGKKLYTQPQEMVFIRECLQNSIDAHATRIDLTIDEKDNGNIWITVSDNGNGISDYAKYFLTIGGSTKRGQTGNIGGYGIAKLSIMSMDNWIIESHDGRITKDILTNGQPKEEVFYNGCKVIGECKPSSYNWKNKITDFLQTINTPQAKIYFNGDPIQTVRTEAFALLNGAKVYRIIDKLHSDCRMIVRLNNFPQFYNSLFTQGKTDSYIFDIQTEEDPYSDDYPVTPNREDIPENNPLRYQLYSNCREIEKMATLEVEAQKQHTENIRFLDSGVVLGGNMTKKDILKYAFHLKTYKRYLIQIMSLMNIESSQFKYGITDKMECGASFSKTINTFLINPLACKRDKAEILSLATHEVTHYYQPQHYEDFTTKHCEILQKVYDGLFDKTFRQ